MPAWYLQKAIDTSHHRGREPFTSHQPRYSLLSRGIEDSVLPVCMNEGLGVIPWWPLHFGWLSGRYHRGMSEPPAGTRVAEGVSDPERWGDLVNEDTWGVLDTLFEVAEEAERTPAQVALRWVMQRPGVTAPIFGASGMNQLEDNLGATGWSLTDEQMARLAAVSDRPSIMSRGL